MQHPGAVIYASAATAVTVAADPGTIDIFGVTVPVIPSLVGVLAVILVRVMVITKSKPNIWSYNLALTGVCLLGTLVTIVDHRLGPGSSFWVGVGFGALGVGVIEIAKSNFASALRTGLQTMFRALAAPTDREG